MDPSTPLPVWLLREKARNHANVLPTGPALPNLVAVLAKSCHTVNTPRSSSAVAQIRRQRAEGHTTISRKEITISSTFAQKSGFSLAHVHLPCNHSMIAR